MYTRLKNASRGSQSVNFEIGDHNFAQLQTLRTTTMQVLRRKKPLKSSRSRSGTGVGVRSGPGAVSVRADACVFRVSVPEDVNPGEEFQIYARSRIVRVRCPEESRPGQTLQITVPSEPAANSSPPLNRSRSPGQGLSDSSLNSSSNESTAPVRLGMGGDRTLRPLDPSGNNSASVDGERHLVTYEIEVPRGVQPGAPFALMAGGVRVMINCPSNASPGQRIRFKLPTKKTSNLSSCHLAENVKLKYDKDEWQRTIRLSDMKFQWVRVGKEGQINTNKRFDVKRSAYVRHIDFMTGDDFKFRTGVLTLVPASEAAVASRIKSKDGVTIAAYADITNAQVKPYDEKVQWFNAMCIKLAVEWNKGHVRIHVRRQRMLSDSIDAVMSLNRRDLRKTWRFDFIQEEGLDAGGLTREWFQLVSTQIFNPDLGLFVSSSANQMNMEINPASSICCEDHLVYYRFFGRVLGKALFDGQSVTGNMTPYLFKHLLGWPVTFRDLEMIDEESYDNLKYLETMASNGDDISSLCLTFTTTEDVVGQMEEREIVKNGATIEVTNDNYLEYLEARLRYRMLDRVRPQLIELLLGFFDVIPEPLLTVFDFKELELLICGLPKIQLSDWKRHTEYTGYFDVVRESDQTCQWFWEIVDEFDQALKARLLQFVTGTSGVPSRGFSVLQGSDGNIRKFTIHGVSLSTCLYPRAQ